jgi:pyruvate-ferredoxin/flavodoxin oxidoreductase
MQSAFFKLANVIEVDHAIALLKASMVKAYRKKGEAVIVKNQQAIDMALGGLTQVELPAHWATATDEPTAAASRTLPKFVQELKVPADRMNGNTIPVSRFSKNAATPTGTTKYEKRRIAVQIPQWLEENCIQCAFCSALCPHAAIRTFALSPAETDKAPDTMKTKPFMGKEGTRFRIQVSPSDCTGCGICVRACPAKIKALELVPIDTIAATEEVHWDYCADQVAEKPDLLPLTTLKGTQLHTPLFEFSGACAGCGEMAYLKLLTQLYGERMVIANASGCSAAVALSYGSAPYCKNCTSGWGPTLANSLFEENAEFGFGIHQGHRMLRAKLRKSVEEAFADEATAKMSEALRIALEKWLNDFEDGSLSLVHSKAIFPLLEKEKDVSLLLRVINEQKDALVKFSTWLVGGDGWAYDINFQGLDHVLSLGSDLNVIVLDTEVYSNTGGQKSKATPMGAVTKFASAGKDFNKKDLGLIAMLYETVYVAQICINANPAHALRCIQEAEAFPGTSLILCYCPCIEHGIEGGDWVQESKLAVSSGYSPFFLTFFLYLF